MTTAPCAFGRCSRRWGRDGRSTPSMRGGATRGVGGSRERLIKHGGVQEERGDAHRHAATHDGRAEGEEGEGDEAGHSIPRTRATSAR